MTVGILLQHVKTLTDEELIKKYMIIMIDEVHERSENVDLVLFYLKGFLERNYDNPDCPILILMSATFEKEVFMKYFNIPPNNYIEVIGKTYPTKIHYEEFPVPNWVEKTIELITKIHTSEEGLIDTGIIPDKDSQDKSDFAQGGLGSLIIEKNKMINKGKEFRDIMVFVSSSMKIKEIIKELNKLNQNSDFNKAGYILPIRLDSASFNKGGIHYQNLFIPINKATVEVDNKKVNVNRKVIIATNVAETGVTIEGLKYLIDTGFVISVEFNPIYAVTSIIIKNVTKGMMTQRIGRVGRKAPGVAYLLYTKEIVDNFLVDQYPELITKEITSSLLASIIRDTDAELVETSLKSNSEFLEDGIIIDNSNIPYKISCANPFSILSLDLLTYPSTDSINYSLEKLYILGFITQNGSTLAPYKKRNNGQIVPTIMGFLANKIRKIKIENIRMIFAGYKYGCNILDLITIAIFLEGSWFDISHKKRRELKAINPLNLKTDEEARLYQRLIIADEFIEYLWIWLLYMDKIDQEHTRALKKSNYKFNLDNVKQWAVDNNYKYDWLLKITSFRDEIIESFINLGYNPYWNGLNLKRGTYNLLNIIRNLAKSIICSVPSFFAIEIAPVN